MQVCEIKLDHICVRGNLKMINVVSQKYEKLSFFKSSLVKCFK